MRGEDDLLRTLRRMDGRGFKAYQDLRGSYRLGDVELHVDHVQGDPFAAPSRLRVRLPLDALGWSAALFEGRVRRTAFEDHLARRIRDATRRERAGARGSGKSGLVEIDAGGQQVLERTAVVATPEWIEARLEVGLPAAGRRVLGREAEELLLDAIPHIAREGMTAGDAGADAEAFIACVENHAALQAQLAERGFVAFLAEGAVLPRESGASERPMGSGAVALRVPDALRATLEVPHAVATASECAGPRADRPGDPFRCHAHRRRRLPRQVHACCARSSAACIPTCPATGASAWPPSRRP